MPSPKSITCDGRFGRCGAETCSTSAPCEASIRPPSGPAITRVRSSTRTPASGRSPAPKGSGADSPMRTISSSGSSATARAWGCASHSSRGRTMPAGSPAAFSASSRSCAFQRGDRRGHGLARLLAAHEAHVARVVVRQVRVDLDPPAVGGGIEAEERAAAVGRGPAVHAQVALAAEGRDGRPHVHRDRLRAPGAQAPELARREPGGRDHRGRRGADPHIGRQHRIVAGQAHPLERAGSPRRSPDLLERLARRRHGTTSREVGRGAGAGGR